jgi:NPCBM/NEW2 domain
LLRLAAPIVITLAIFHGVFGWADDFASDHGDADKLLHTSQAIMPLATLVELNAKLQWVFDVDASQKTLDMKQVFRWGTWHGIQHSPAVWLSDGSWVAGNIKFPSADQVAIRSDFFEPIDVPIRDVRGMVLASPGSLSGWIRLQTELKSAAGNRDTVWLKGNRQVSGVLRVVAVEGQVSPTIELENAGQKISLEYKEIQAIVFSPTLLGKQTQTWQGQSIGIADGSLLHLESMTTERGRVKFALSDHLVLKSLDSRPEFAKAVTYIANSQDASYLSKLEPASYRNVTQSQLTWALGRDRDVAGFPLVSGNGIVEHGVAMHSSSQAAYRWDGRQGRLLAEVRMARPVDGADPKLGSVICQVLLARDGKLQSVFSTKLDRSEQLGKLIDVDISGAKLVVLVTEQSDFGQHGDHLLWLDARFANQ